MDISEQSNTYLKITIGCKLLNQVLDNLFLDDRFQN